MAKLTAQLLARAWHEEIGPDVRLTAAELMNRVARDPEGHPGMRYAIDLLNGFRSRPMTARTLALRLAQVARADPRIAQFGRRSGGKVLRWGLSPAAIPRNLYRSV